MKIAQVTFIYSTMTFNDFGLDAPILKAINDKGFETPTPIQQEAIPILLSQSTDLIGLAGTGTGKTAAFGIPLLSVIEPNSKKTQGIILSPTRELCIQIAKELTSFSTHMPSVSVVAVYGGASMQDQIRSLNRGADVIVATPGRLIDMIKRGHAVLQNIKVLVLDEADEMLNMGFKEDLDIILETTPKSKNTWLFSATMPKEVSRIAQQYMSSPVEITVGNKNQASQQVDHKAFVVHERDRYDALKRLLDFYPDIYGIVFCRTRIETQRVADRLIKDGYNSQPLHGDHSQAQREQVMKTFRERALQILVATDVAARGIDVDDITHVIHYNLPDEAEVYTHRSGRTGRAGKSGISLSIINTREKRKLTNVERVAKLKINVETLPSGREVCEKQVFSIVSDMANVAVREEEIAPFMEAILENLKDLPKEEVIKRFVSVEFNRFLDYYKNSKDLNANLSGKNSRDRDDRGSSRGDRGDRRDRGDRQDRGGRRERDDRNDGDESMTPFVVEGVPDHIRKGALVRVLCDNAGLSSDQIGAIRFSRGLAIIDVANDLAPAVDNLGSNIGIDGNQYPIRRFERGGKPRGGGRKRSSGGGGRKPRSGGSKRRRP